MRTGTRLPAHGTNGNYTFLGLAAGNYRLSVVPDAEPGEWLSPAFLQNLLAASTAVTLALGDTKTMDLKVRQESR